MTIALYRRPPGKHRAAGHHAARRPAPGVLTVGLLVLVLIAGAVGPVAALVLIEHHRGEIVFPRPGAAFAGTGALLVAASVMVALPRRPERPADRPWGPV
ncbi:hypothetical protein [Nocardia carnea]|uniref:hypothetical protein n=1 Tax=Nocardia carnea TaxID=37328 RepID=UPI0024552EBB|nr:hypothetical protein [Nocardia carnea]